MSDPIPESVKSQLPKRGRGRPSKAEQEERAKLLAELMEDPPIDPEDTEPNPKEAAQGSAGYELKPLPSNGRCYCGHTPYPWKSQTRPQLGFWCPNNVHGGNGRFWMAQEKK